MPENHLQNAMATALSLDYWSAPEDSLCACQDKRLSVNFLCMDQVSDDCAKANVGKTAIPRAARFQEIFLDLTGCLASRYSSSRFFLDDRFDSRLDDEDRRLKEGIITLLSTPSRERSATYNALLSRLEEDFGLNLDEALKRRRDGNVGIRKMRSMSSMSFVPPDTKRDPDTKETEILQEVVDRIKEVASIKRAAAMINVSGDFNSLDLNRLKDFVELYRLLDPWRIWGAEYTDLQLEFVFYGAHEDVKADFWRLFLIPSHVFVCNSSVCELACDAFLCPVASIAVEELDGVIWKRWKTQTKKTNVDLWRDLTGRHQYGHVEFDKGQRVAVPKWWPEDCTQPLILPTEVLVLGDDADLQKIDRLMESARDFLRVAYDLVKDRDPMNGRERHLLALPVIGTGGGGARNMTGEIVENLFRVLDKFVSKHKVDCVIVAADEATYAHAQAVRKKPSSILNVDKLKAAEDLAQVAASGHLSLFLGAGTSIPSGLPSWTGLLNKIERQLTGEQKIGKECNGDLLRMADKLEDLASSDANGKCLKTRVADLIKKETCHPSLVLALLLSLPSKSIVTTNYDELIETAYRNQNVASSDRSDLPQQPGHARQRNGVNIISSNLSILPHQPKPGAQKWLLKMHGCVSHPKKIVLSGKDYAESKVLTGIVQANLLTTHLLFCGFSLTDPNYEKVLKEVRDALHSDREGVPSTNS